MSGDVQPRKRKDKKRRKDEAEQILTQSTHTPISTNSPSDDVNIHVHKEGGTGGGICAKLVFFVLLSALVVVIGMIITQYRGLSDVDTVDTESKFSQIFEGWIDTGHRHHEHEVEEALEDHEHEDEGDIENVSDAEDEDHEASEEEDESEEKELSEENDEDEDDEEEEDEEPAVEHSEEEQPEESEENSLDEEEDDNEEVSEEKETYGADDSEEKEDDEEDDHDDEQDQEEDEIDHDEDEQELQNIASDEDDNHEDNTDDQNGSTEKASNEDEDEEDEADEDTLKEDDADESDEKTPATPEKVVEKREVEEDTVSGEEKQQESAGSAAAKEADDSDSDRQSNEGADYEHTDITSREDYKIKEKLDEAQKSVKNTSAYAIKLFDTILQKYPHSPRSIYGKALSLDHLADQRRSNSILEEALQHYLRLLNMPDVPDALFLMAAERCINRMRFVGQYRNAINVHWKLIKKFPNNPKHSNNLAVTYLTINRVEEARAVLKEVLSKWPDDGFALVHYGFILKTTDNVLEEAVIYLKRGLDTKAEGVIDGRFYFHLGDALARLGKAEEAMEIYEEGVKNKVFLSKYQRSLYNVPRLTGKPWWDLEDLPYLDLYRLLTQNWQKIRDEGLAVLNAKANFQDESENLKDTGDWKQFELFARGQKNVDNCKKCPFTCSIIEKIPEAKGCKRGQTKFSVMHPETHVWPHCGPTNCRLRMHLGLKVPPKTFIRVADEIRSWREGKVFVFDDSFEHEVWHNGTDFRLVLIVDVWHPELTSTEKKNLSPI